MFSRCTSPGVYGGPGCAGLVPVLSEGLHEAWAAPLKAKGSKAAGQFQK